MCIRDSYRGGTGIMVDISDLSSDTEDSSDIIKSRIIQAMMNNAATSFSVSSEPSEQLWSKMSIEMSDYGATDGVWDWSWSGDRDIIVQGSTTYEAVEGDFNVSVNWYPSVGFFVTVISLLSFLGSIFREYF